MAFTAKDVAELRAKTNAGMMDCKKALTEADGDMEKAVEILREKGLAAQAKKSGRIAAEGVVLAYTDEAAGVSVVVEVNSETDFVAKNETFKALVLGVAKTVAEQNPESVEALQEMTMSGRDVTVAAAFQEAVLSIGENMKIRRFERVEGHAVTYVHGGGTVGVLVKFDTDDATAAKPEFTAMGKNVAMQVAAMNPEYLCKDDISADELAKMKTIIIESTLNKPETLPKPILVNVIEKAISEKAWDDETIAIYEEQKNNKFLFNFLSPEAINALAQVAVAHKDEYIANPIFSKATEGRIAKQIKEVCLLDQAFVRSDLFEGAVGGYVNSVAKALGAGIKVVSFIRYERGEGLQKKEENFADEIAKMVQ